MNTINKKLMEDFSSSNEMIKEALQQTFNKTQQELPFSLTPSDIQDLLPISSTKVYQLLRRNELPGKKIDGKWIIPRENFLTWLILNEQD